MKEVKVKLYKFEELSEEVRKSIVDKERWNVGYETMDCYASDYEGTLKKFSELMGVKVHYEVDYCGYHFSFDFQNDYAFGNYWLDYCISHEECTGKLLRRWLNNNFMPFALDAKKYYKYDAGYDREKHRWNKYTLTNKLTHSLRSMSTKEEKLSNLTKVCLVLVIGYSLTTLAA